MTQPRGERPPSSAPPSPGSAPGWAAIRWTPDGVEMLDQRRLPEEEVYVTLRDAEGVARAIEQMVIRGAPAIGCAAAMGVALAALASPAADVASLRQALEPAFERIARTRPTAVNLAWALARMRAVAAADAGGADAVADLRRRLVEAARAIQADDIERCRSIGRAGLPLVPARARILTHCNAGALATGGYGTALGIVRAAAEAGLEPRVLADETRPFLQGARLTAWELHRDGIPVTVITDGMAGHLMARGEVDCVIVGADRVAANGDVANKIGTYALAVLAHRHGLPFYVAAPLSTVDPDTPDGAGIPIEERGRDEVALCGDRVVVPDGVPVRHPAFDVTPAELVTALVTERGVLRAPSSEGVRALLSAER